MDNGMIALYGIVAFLFVLMMVAVFIHEKGGKSSYREKRMRVKSLKYRVK